METGQSMRFCDANKKSKDEFLEAARGRVKVVIFVPSDLVAKKVKQSKDWPSLAQLLTANAVVKLDRSVQCEMR